jgi:hypothetical protein
MALTCKRKAGRFKNRPALFYFIAGKENGSQIGVKSALDS